MNHWSVSLENSVKNLTEDQADWKRKASENTIHEIITHVNFYLLRYLDRFKGIPATQKVNSNDDSFMNVSGESWADTENKLYQTMKEWRELTAAADQDTLSRPVYENGTGEWSKVIADIALHAAYHAGQIITIRKQNGWWDPNDGVH
jgi:uncharacterized damage-inducible protein DinB